MPPPLFISMQIMQSVEGPTRKRSFSWSESSMESTNESRKRSRLAISSDNDTAAQPNDNYYDSTEDSTEDEDFEMRPVSMFDWSESDDEADEDPHVTLAERRRDYFEAASQRKRRESERGSQSPPSTPVCETISWREYFAPVSQRKGRTSRQSSPTLPYTPVSDTSASYDSGVFLTPVRFDDGKSRRSAQFAALDVSQSPEPPATPASPMCESQTAEDHDSVLESSLTHFCLPWTVSTDERYGSKYRQRFSWGRVHMLTLVLLRTEFKGSSWNETTTRFSTLFKQDIVRQGIPSGGLGTKAISDAYSRHLSESYHWREANALLERGGSDIDQLKSSIRQAVLSGDPLEIPPSTSTISGMTPWKTPRTHQSHKTFKMHSAHKPISPEQAHPFHSVLLFRCYHAETQGTNSPQGFVAGRFAQQTTPISPPPHCSDPRMLEETYAHLDRHHIPTPFISTTDALAKLLIRALRDAKKGHECRVCIIDTVRLPQTSIYHAAPYHAALKSHGPPFTGTNGRYNSATEYLVWGAVPAAAVLHDLPLADIERFVNGHDVLRPVIRLGLLGNMVPYGESLRDRLKDSTVVYLTPTLIPALADLCAFLLIADNDSPNPNEATTSPPPPSTAPSTAPSTPLISRLLGEVIRDWYIQVDARKPAIWLDYSTLFALEFMSRERTDPGVFSSRFVWLCEGFLWGVRVGLCGRRWWDGREGLDGSVKGLRERGLLGGGGGGGGGGV